MIPYSKLVEVTPLILNLVATDTVALELGRDHLDLIALRRYNSYDYWQLLAIYNGVVTPFNLLSQGLTEVKLPGVRDLDRVRAQINR